MNKQLNKPMSHECQPSNRLGQTINKGTITKATREIKKGNTKLSKPQPYECQPSKKPGQTTINKGTVSKVTWGKKRAKTILIKKEYNYI